MPLWLLSLNFYQKIGLLSILVVMQTTILLRYVVKWDIFHLGVEQALLILKSKPYPPLWDDANSLFSWLWVVSMFFHTDNNCDVRIYFPRQKYIRKHHIFINKPPINLIIPWHFFVRRLKFNQSHFKPFCHFEFLLFKPFSKE